MSGIVRLKSGVQLHGLQPAGIRILAATDQCARFLGIDQVVTCGTEGHGPRDPHTRGCALDLRTRHLPLLILHTTHAYLTQNLGPLFTVLYETPTLPRDPQLAMLATVNQKASAPHFHIQLRKDILTWPPLTT